ncbi:nucleotidyltransferase domain-containing protein [Paenibacillus sp. FSL H7-0331]|uniref:nucleotidyltransferase domain-containing protein n=1 Tax=Paenibacillus sp. FSL H7-0331 TaxID=1920421 RepID=UPI00096FE051|nr:nucleotidyltransferase domain-containing protein [Paenibacillus sp. FSL H7-0331]OMF18416.1 hypothetical protein BK127_11655 [Paenibacillus sp. FSL H7-0331]
MESRNPEVSQIIESFITNEILNCNELEAIILCGSQATGKATANSDIDLCYMGEFAEFKREYRMFNGYEFQIMIAPWIWYRDVITSFERTNNIGTITSMLANGICLWSRSNCWDELQKEALHHLNMGPVPASNKELSQIRRRITDLWNNYIDSDSELDSYWIGNHLLHSCVEAQFVINNWWSVKTKYQMHELMIRDPYAVKFIKDYVGMEKTRESLQALCEHVLNPIGGWIGGE